MNKIHITLVGGQTYPVYLGISETKPDMVLLICSEKTEKEANHIAKEILPINSEKVFLDPVDTQKIFNSAQKLANSLDENSYYTVNITGGTKPWSISFYDALHTKKNVELIYIDQNNIIWNLSQNEHHESTVPLDMDVLFRLNNTSIKHQSLLKDYNEKDENVKEEIKKMRAFNFDQFNKLTTILSRKDEKQLEEDTGHFYYEGGQVTWDRTQPSVTLNMTKDGIEKQKVFKSPHVMEIVFKAGWFEYEIAQILSHWKYAKEIRMNVVFPYANNLPKNEIDVIVNTGKRLLYVECKTQIKDITAIDKFRTVVKNTGGLSSKALFITQSMMKNTAIEKSEDNDIVTFSISDCKLDTEKMLFLKLDQIMNIIQPK
jgi:hypothetical protein